nr:MAG TPA: hypothetical protein [Caudoviricetes sp.]
MTVVLVRYLRQFFYVSHQRQYDQSQLGFDQLNRCRLPKR